MKRIAASRLLRDQRGFMLVEILVAVAILGVVAVAFLSALTTSYMTVVVADENTMAESLTRTEFERIRNAGYPASPTPVPVDKVFHYKVLVTVDNVSAPESISQMQKVTVEVRHGGLWIDAKRLLSTITYIAEHDRNLPPPTP